MAFDELLEVLPQIDLLAGVGSRGGGLGDVAINVAVDGTARSRR